MAKNVFTNDTVADFHNTNFVNAKIDMEKPEGREIAEKYGIRAYPTMLYLSSEGTLLHRTCGSSPAQQFLAISKDALSPKAQLAGYSAKFNAGNITPEFASKYFEMLEQGCQSMDKEIDKYFISVKQNDFTNRPNWEIIYTYLENYDSKTFQNFEANKTAFAKLYGIDSVEQKINKAYTMGLYSAIRSKDAAKYESIKAKLRASNTKNAERIILQTDIKQSEYTQDWKKFASLVSEYFQLYPSQNANELNNYAWAFYEHVDDKKMLENAEKWALQATQLEDAYHTNDTYAAVLFKLGKKTEAKKAAEKAIDLAKQKGEDYKETEELLKKINELK
jgi:hypothetical protein